MKLDQKYSFLENKLKIEESMQKNIKGHNLMPKPK